MVHYFNEDLAIVARTSFKVSYFQDDLVSLVEDKSFIGLSPDIGL